MCLRIITTTRDRSIVRRVITIANTRTVVPDMISIMAMSNILVRVVSHSITTMRDIVVVRRLMFSSCIGTFF